MDASMKNKFALETSQMEICSKKMKRRHEAILQDLEIDMDIMDMFYKMTRTCHTIEEVVNCIMDEKDRIMKIRKEEVAKIKKEEFDIGNWAVSIGEREEEADFHATHPK